jgi:DNA-binding PadR family transcriptional regulator
METIQGDQLRGHLETLVLSTLERGEAHGLEILRRLEEAGCGLLRLKEGSLYPALYRLEESGKVEAAWEEGPHGRRGARRRLYRLTRKGKQQLADGRVEWQRFVNVVGGILGAPA